MACFIQVSESHSLWGNHQYQALVFKALFVYNHFGVAQLFKTVPNSKAKDNN